MRLLNWNAIWWRNSILSVATALFWCGCMPMSVSIKSDPSGAKAYAYDQLSGWEYLGVTPVTGSVLGGLGGINAYVNWPDGTTSQAVTSQSGSFYFRQPGYISPEQRRAIAEAKQQAENEAERVRQDKLAELINDENPKDVFGLDPSGLGVADVNDAILTWKNKHLDSVLRNAKTEELRDYVDEIEHTILQATDAEEKQKDKAQRLIAAGTSGDTQFTDLARAYHLRIEVLKPILAAIREEVANRGK